MARFISALLAGLLSLGLGAGEEKCPAPPSSADAYDYLIADGLYATVTAMQSFKAPDVPQEKELTLKNIYNFKKDIKVRAVIQDQPAPLAVILLGLTSKSKGPLARLWEAQLRDAGCHVLVFDSIFRPALNERSAHGVTGNLEAEACVVANVIRAFLEHPQVADKVTQLGLLGASYGGSLALSYAKLAKSGRIKLAPKRVLVFSPPLGMRTASEILDHFYDEYRQNFSFFSLLKLRNLEPVPAGQPIPFTASLMRAGIGYTFHSDLEDAISNSKDVYHYQLPSEGDKNDKNHRLFTRFIEEVVYPYWKQHGGAQTLEDLWAYGSLDKLLAASPDYVKVILAADDPLNDPVLLEYVRRDAPPEKLTVLPRGGHLGFVGCQWAKARVMGLFTEK
jgi:predicted alpha/beta-fold hydrolase